MLLFTVLTTANIQPNTQDEKENIVLITGFKPFDVYTVNPSELIALELNNTLIENVTIKGYVLPVNYTTAPMKMKHLISTFHPDLIISLGLAGNANKITIERIGLNLRIDPEVTYPLFTLRKINTQGPWIQQATYDVQAIITSIEKENIPVEQSYSAGLYLCNALLYETLYYQEKTNQSIPTGFIHVPQLDSQHPDGMTFDTMIIAVRTAIRVHIS